MEKFALNAALLDAPAAAKESGSPAADIAKLSEVIVQVGFHPNGLVNTINHLPGQLSPQAWFDALCREAPLAYQPLSGGRAAFRVQSDVLESISRQAAA